MVGIISSLSLEAFGYWIFHALLFEGAGDMIILFEFTGSLQNKCSYPNNQHSVSVIKLPTRIILAAHSQLYAFVFFVFIPFVLYFDTDGVIYVCYKICCILSGLIWKLCSNGTLCMNLQIINVYNQEYESAAAFWPDVHGRIIVALIVSQLLLMGLLSTKEAARSTPLLIALPVLTIWFHRFCKGRYEPAFVRYPLQVCSFFFFFWTKRFC